MGCILGWYPPPPLRKRGQGQKNNGHTGSPCLDKPVLARDAQHKETLHTENLPVPHTKHITHKHGTRTQRVGKFSMVLMSLLPINGYGIETFPTA